MGVIEDANNWEMKNFLLHSGTFNKNLHKRFFPNYLEVIILEDGTIRYAVPSHNEAALRIAAKKLNKDPKELYWECPKERYVDVDGWIREISGCIFVWETFYLGNLNEAQFNSLKELKDFDIYEGILDKPYYDETQIEQNPMLEKYSDRDFEFDE